MSSSAATTDFIKEKIFTPSFDSSIACFESCFKAAEKLADINFAFSKKSVSLCVENSRLAPSCVENRDFSPLAAAGAAHAEALNSWLESVGGVMSDVAGDIAGIVEGRVGDMRALTSEAVDRAAKSAPAGSEIAVSAVKGAIAASAAAYDSASSAAKQVADTVKSGVKSLSDAAKTQAAKTAKTAAKPR